MEVSCLQTEGVGVSQISPSRSSEAPAVTVGERLRSSFLAHTYILAGIAFGALFWPLESLIHVLAFEGGIIRFSACSLSIPTSSGSGSSSSC